jgi:hypothetical protein
MKRAILLILGALVLLGGLTGCARDERAVKAEQHAKNLIENFAKNQNILQEGERRMYRAEAESHVTTHFKWDVERISNSPIERTAAIAEVSRLADVRVAKLKEVEARVQGMKDAYELTLKDLVGARALYQQLQFLRSVRRWEPS